MQVIVGNPTLQNRDFHYRYPGQKTTRVVPIPAGGQSRLPDDFSGAELQNVISQLERLGAVPVNDIGAIILPKQLVYSVSPKPIDVEKLEEGLARDEEARQEVASVKMEESGLSAFTAAEKAQNTQGARGRLVETSIEVVETNDRGKVKDGVNAEFVVSTKPQRRAGKKRTEDKH